MTMPAEHLRRSFLARKLVEAGANFAPHFDAAVAEDFGDTEAEVETAATLGLADLSPLPRWGLKGAGGPEWLQSQGVAVPETPNRAEVQADGALVARLSAGEVLVLANPTSDQAGLPHSLGEAWDKASLPPESPRGFPLPRQDSYAWLILTGAAASAMMAKICAVDLRINKFANLAIAQTSVARTSTVTIRQDFGDVPAFHLIFDSASADYMWICLIDAMEEFQGRAVGLTAIRKLLET